MCKHWKRWPSYSVALLVKGIMWGAVAVNSSFLCCIFISSREFQQGLSKQTRRLRSKDKPNVQPVTVNIYSAVTAHFQVSLWPPQPPPSFRLHSIIPPYIHFLKPSELAACSVWGTVMATSPQLTAHHFCSSFPLCSSVCPLLLNLRQRASECVNCLWGVLVKKRTRRTGIEQ